MWLGALRKPKLTLPINMPYLAYIRYSLSECDQEVLVFLNKSVMTTIIDYVLIK
jgi:hypothetical protein